MWLVRLAVLNLLRSRWRTGLSLAAVVVGVAALIIGQGFIAGLTENMVRAQVDSVSAHVLARPLDYPRHGLAHPTDQMFSVDDELATWLDDHSQAWTRRMVFSPTAAFRADALRIRAIAVDLDADEAVFPREGWKLHGAFPVEGEVLVSRGVSRLLGVDVDDVLTLQVRTPTGAMNALALPVAGVMSAGNPYLDRLAVIVPYETAGSLLQAPDMVTHLALRQSSRSASGARVLGDELSQRLGEGQEVVTWFDETQSVRDLQEVRQRGLDLLIFVLMGMSAAGIANTIMMAAYERIREIGTLRAMGMTRRDVRRLFVIEGALLGAVGGALGAVAAAVVILWFHQHGIDLSEVLEKGASGHIPVATMLYPALELDWFLLAPAFGTVVSAVASVYPAKVASDMAPADAVRA